MKKYGKVVLILAFVMAIGTCIGFASDASVSLPITRGEAFGMIGSWLGLAPAEEAYRTFPDYDGSDAPLNSMVNAGYVLGRGNGLLSSDDTLTKEELAYVLSRMEKPVEKVVETRTVTRHVVEYVEVPVEPDPHICTDAGYCDICGEDTGLHESGHIVDEYSGICYTCTVLHNQCFHLFFLNQNGVYECIECGLTGPVGTGVVGGVSPTGEVPVPHDASLMSVVFEQASIVIGEESLPVALNCTIMKDGVVMDYIDFFNEYKGSSFTASYSTAGSGSGSYVVELNIQSGIN